MNKKIVSILSILVIGVTAIIKFSTFIGGVQAATPCIITLFGNQYDVTSLTTNHTGGNIFQCGTDMTATYLAQHGADLTRMAPFLISPTLTPTVNPTPTPTIVQVTPTPTSIPTETTTVTPTLTVTPTPTSIHTSDDRDDDEQDEDDVNENENEDKTDIHEQKTENENSYKEEHEDKVHNNQDNQGQQLKAVIMNFLQKRKEDR